jgi:hypothetical protein
MATSLAKKLVIENLKSTPKERVDMILEPLQVMIQLAILGYCPKGTKISISENTLLLQRPTWAQGVWRWYGRDCREDLYYLFHAIRRFYLWYKNEDEGTYNYILERSKEGIKRLIETYDTERSSLIHTLNLYKNILDLESPDLFKTDEEGAINIDSVFKNIVTIYDKKLLRSVICILKLLEAEKDKENIGKYCDGLQNILDPTQKSIKNWIREKLTC